ncbi:MAG TPA: I78 family peptidase inhibitor [Allosphingosinicella sp.]|nr:I78 family peptidase inhibitor [Allosphingosinicella sp.]
MKILVAGAMLMAGCATTVPPDEPEDVPVRGETGRKCSPAPAQKLVGQIATKELGAEAMRLTGAGAMRWIPQGGMVTMDYREDRVNIHLDAKNRVAKIACG